MILGRGRGFSGLESLPGFDLGRRAIVARTGFTKRPRIERLGPA
jgi:hypothetical protein